MSSDIKNIAGTSVLSTGTKTQGPEPSATLAKTAINKRAAKAMVDSSSIVTPPAVSDGINA